MNVTLTKEDKLLLNEAGLSSTCLGQGLTALRKANFVFKWNYYQAFFLLTIGIERLLKVIIVSKYKVENNCFPKNEFLKKLGHDIKQLIQVVESYNLDDKKIEGEIELLIIDFLTNFAKSSRYYNLDAITGSGNSHSPLSEWKVIQNKIKEKEGLVSKPLHPDFLSLADSFATFIQHDEDGNLVSGAGEFYKDSNIIDKLQGYSVFYVWKIIQNLADKLRAIEYQYNTFPCLREFFPYFIEGWDEDEDIDILKWKDWNYLK